MGKLENAPYNVLSDDAYIIYLRKSRADNPSESVEEVLAKHETMLQEYAERELGGRIPEHCIYREVVSGETIEERPEMIEVLKMIESPKIRGVLVVEPQRLSRGDLEDCGKIVNNFRYTNTEIITLNMIYDLNNKMQRKFFEQELMRGNDFLEYTKEILHRGRIASIKKGNYIGNIPPFGYDKAVIDGCPSLKPNDNADAVRLVFDLYNKGVSPLFICRKLDTLGIKPMNRNKWKKSTIRRMLENPHYIGLVRYGFTHTERTVIDGQLVKQRNRPADESETIIAKGKHEAIISDEVYNMAQERIKNNPRAKWDAPLKNPLAGLLFCKKCGYAMSLHPYKKARDRYECTSKKYGMHICESKSVPVDELLDNVIWALEQQELPDLKAKVNSGAGEAAAIQKRLLKKMNADLEKLQKQEDKQYELLEKEVYSEDIFKKRNNELRKEMEELKSKIFNAKQSMPKEVNYSDKVIRLKDAIAALRREDIPAEDKNKLLKAIIERIDYEFLSYEGRGQVKYKLHIKILL